MTGLRLRTPRGVTVTISPGVIAESYTHRGAGKWRLVRLAERVLAEAPTGGEVQLAGWGAFRVERSGPTVSISLAGEVAP